MYKKTYRILFIFKISLLLLLMKSAQADIQIKMDATIIKANTELPKILYIVPWKKTKHFKHDEQLFIIHSLYGDLFEPIINNP